MKFKIGAKNSIARGSPSIRYFTSVMLSRSRWMSPARLQRVEHNGIDELNDRTQVFIIIGTALILTNEKAADASSRTRATRVVSLFLGSHRPIALLGATTKWNSAAQNSIDVIDYCHVG